MDGRRQLLRGFRNRRTRQQLVHLGIARPLSNEQTDPLYERALSPSSTKAAADLDRALASRPTLQDLVSTGVVPKDAVIWTPLETGCDLTAGLSFPPPAARNCHTLDLVGGLILLVAGHSTPDSSTIPYCLDLRTARWRPIFAQMMASTHAKVDELLPSGGCGAAVATGLRAGASTHLHQHDAAASAEIPCARYAHATTECCGDLLLMGGYGEQQWLNDVWVFKSEQQVWHAANIVNGIDGIAQQWPVLHHTSSAFELPAPRAAHSLTAIPVQAWARAIETAKHPRELAGAAHDSLHTSSVEEACAILFGGNDKNGLFNDVWLLRQLPSTVTSSDAGLQSCHLLWLKPIVVGDTPTPRAGHSAILFGASLIVFGGSRGWGTEAFNDLHVLDVGNVRPWSQLDLQHETSEQDADSLVFWYHPAVSGQAPAARAGHTATLIGNNMLVFGGSNSTQCFNDLHVLQCSTFTWSTPIRSGPSPMARSGAAAVAVGDTMVIFGGASFTGELLNDVHLLETDFLGRTASAHCAATAGRAAARAVASKQDSVVPQRTSAQPSSVSTECTIRTSSGFFSKTAGPSAQIEQSPQKAAVLQAYSQWKADWAHLKSVLLARESEQQASFDKLLASVTSPR